jgi:hypothetical protein
VFPREVVRTGPAAHTLDVVPLFKTSFKKAMGGIETCA